MKIAIRCALAGLLMLTAPGMQAEAPSAADCYTVDYLTVPDGEVVEVGGMAFHPDGGLLVSTRRGKVWWIDNALAEDPSEARFHLFCEGLHEGLGLRIVGEDIFVVQRSELSRLVDLDGDRVCDRIETICDAWGMSGNYHEFAFGLPQDKDGNFYLTTNVSFASPEWWLGVSTQPYRGWVLQVSPDGEMTPWATGVRSPAGLGQDSQGRIYYTENQGDWMPACGLFEVCEGEFYGHPAGLRWRPEFLKDQRIPSRIEPPETPRDPPALWIPYEWSRSTGAVIEDETGGKFGPFGGQMFLAELTNGMVLRAMLEEVEGHLQGACIPFREEIGSAFRLEFAPDGTLFAGFTNRGWGGLSPGSGIARLRWSGEVPQEVASVALQPDGFRVGLTRPLAQAPTAAGIEVYDYDYNWWWDYGSPMMRKRTLKVLGVELDAARTGLAIRVEGLQAGRNVRVTLKDMGLVHEQFDYTIHRMPGSPETHFVAKLVEPPAVDAHPDKGWLTLTWLDPFDAWESEGWELVNAELNPEDPTRLKVTPGNGALVNTGLPASGFQSKAEFGDIEFRFSFMLPEGGDSGLYFMGRYELQLVDDVTQCLGLIGSKGPRAKGYRGPGEWHVVTGKFYAPRFDADGNKIAHARFDQIEADGVMVIGSAEVESITPGGLGGPEVARGPLFFQGNAGQVAMGDIRVKHLVEGEEVHTGEPEDWVPLASNTEAFGEFELRGNLSLSDKGGAAIWLALPDAKTPFADAQGPRLILDHNSAAEGHTGTLLGLQLSGNSRDGFVRTQLLQPGVPFDFRLRCERHGPGLLIRVWLGGIEVNRVTTEHPWPPAHIRLQAERVPGTELEVNHLEIRAL